MPRALQPSSERYLWRRPNSRFIWFRMAVPKAHRDAVGKSLVAFSLATTDAREASLRAAEVRAQLAREWQQLARSIEAVDGEASFGAFHAPGEREMDLAAVRYAYEQVGELSNDAMRRKDDETRQEFVQSCKEKLEDVRRERFDRTFTEGRRLAAGLIRREGWAVTPDSKLFLEQASRCTDALLDALQRIVGEQVEGRIDPEPQTPTVKRAKAYAATTATPGERIMNLYERFAQRRLQEGRQSEDTVKQNRKVVELLASVVGPDRAVNSISIEEARDFRDTLAALPPNYGKQKRFKGMAIQQVASRARELGLPPTRPANLNRQLAAVSGFFDGLQQDRRIASNPFAGLNYRVRKEDNRRPPFDTDQLNALLASPLFTRFLAAGKEHLKGNLHADDWRYWIPLICLFTGARIGEAAQLHVDDIRWEHDVWLIHFRHDPSKSQATKSRKCRAIPVHRVLEEIGFARFCQRQAQRAERDGAMRLFPDIERDSRGTLGGRPSRFWRDYLRRIGLKTGRDGLGAHSFRHGVSDQLRLAEYTDDQLGPLVLGHSSKSVTSGYGKLPQGTVRMLNEMIQAMRFDGVRFDHLAP